VEHEFRTFRGYTLENRGEGVLTPSLEDYLEMLYRMCATRGFTRVGELAAALNVQPPSVSRAVRKLAEEGLIHYTPYGVLHLTDAGKRAGRVLLKRHELVQTFLELLGSHQNLIEDTERIEHLLSDETLDNMARFVEFASRNNEWIDQFHAYRGTTDDSQ